MWSWCVVKPNSVIMCPDFHALSHGFIEEQKHNRKKKKQISFHIFAKTFLELPFWMAGKFIQKCVSIPDGG